MSRLPRTGTLLASLAVVCLVLPMAAMANMAAPRPPGQAIGEPSGELADLHIEHEELTLDLRPLELAFPVRVSATYRVRNDGEQRSVELVFVAAALSNGRTPTVSLDGAPVLFQAETTTGTQQPRGVAWAPPSTTPDFSGGQLDYRYRYLGAIYFTLDIAPGAHDIHVEYDAETTAREVEPARIWQIGYVLSPARDWASFGTLDVHVQLPPSFRFASEPPLQVTGTDARGTFTGVPADALSITARYDWAPLAPDYGLAIAIGLAVGIGVLLAIVGGWWLGRRGKRARSLLPISLLYGGLAAFAVVFSQVGSLGRRVQIPVPQQPPTYLNTSGVVDFLLLLAVWFPLTFVVIVLVMQLVAAISSRSSRPKPAQLAG